MSSPETPKFSIKLRSDKILTNIFKTYKEFSDNCDLIFTPDRLIIKCKAPDKVSYLYTVILKDDCMEYWSKKSLSCEIDLGIINKVLKRQGPNDNLVISSHDDDQILIILRKFQNDRKFYISFKETNESAKDIEKGLKKLNSHTNKGIHFLIPIEEFSTIIKDALVTTNTLKVFYEYSHIRFSNDEEEYHNYEYIFKKEIEHKELEDPFIAGYDLDKFDKYCKNTINKQFFCSFTVQGPAKLTQKFFHDSEFIIFIAPRMDEEEEEEEQVEIHSNGEQTIEEGN